MGIVALVPSTTEAATLSVVGTPTGEPGAEVLVPIHIDLDDGDAVTSFSFEVTFASLALDYVGTEKGDLTSSWAFFNDNAQASSVRVAGLNQTPLSSDGILAILRFQVQEGVAPATVAPIQFISADLNDGQLPADTTSGSVTAGDVADFSAPNLVAAPGASVTVPITVDGDVAGGVSFSFDLVFDSAILENPQTPTEGALITSWSFLTSTTGDRISIAGLSSTALTGGGVVAEVVLDVKAGASNGAQAALTLENVQVNDGHHAAFGNAGQIDVSSSLTTAYVDINAGGGGNGTVGSPFNSVVDAMGAVVADPVGILRIKPGTYLHNLRTATLNKPMRLERDGASGVVRIEGFVTKGAYVKTTKATSDASASTSNATSSATSDDDSVVTSLWDAIAAASADSDDDNASDTENDEAQPRYAAVIPATHDGALSVDAQGMIAVRLRDAEGLDPATLWGDVSMGGVAMEWRPVNDGDTSDIWVIFHPQDTWSTDGSLNVQAGGQNAHGDATASATYNVQTQTNAPQTGDALWQPTYDDYDTSAMDITAESTNEITLTQNGADTTADTLSQGITTPITLGPPTLYSQAQRAWIPIPHGVDPANVTLYYYHHDGAASNWQPAESIQGFLVPSSTLHLTLEGANYLGILINHPAIIQLGNKVTE
jgi:hypothetical protein